MKHKILLKIILLGTVLILTLLGENSQAYTSVDEYNNTGLIYVTGIEDGAIVEMYKLINVNFDYEASQLMDPPYTWVDEVQVWIDTNYPEYSDPAKYFEVAGQKDLTEFYNDIAAAIKDEKIEINLAISMEADEETTFYPEELTGTAQVDGCEMGTYLVLIGNTENIYKIYNASAVNLMPEYNETDSIWILQEASVEMKSSTTPSITKEILLRKSEKEAIVISQDLLSNNNVVGVNTGYYIDFIVTIDVPQYIGGSDETIYRIKEKLLGGLIFLNFDLHAYGINEAGETTELISDSDSESSDYYTITFDAQENVVQEEDLIIEFDYSKISEFAQIVLVYNARLESSGYDALTQQTEKLILGKNRKANDEISLEYGNNNETILEYSINSYNTENTQTAEILSTMYTYGAKIIKTSENGKPLEGAIFELYDENLELVEFYSYDGVFYRSEKSGSYLPLTTNENGEMYLYGLDAGRYTLMEKSAPDGYLNSSDTVVFEIYDGESIYDNLSEEEKAKYYEYTGIEKIYRLEYSTAPDGTLDEGSTYSQDNDSGIVVVEIFNQLMYELPATGGIGTTIFATCGVILVGVGVILLLVVIKKKRKTK